MRAIIFDFDGVIADSEPLHEIAVREAVRTMGMDVTHEEFVAEYVGHGDLNCFGGIGRAHGRELSNGEFERLKELKLEALIRLVGERPPRAQPGAVELIRSAAERVPVAVCSGSRKPEVEPILESLGVLECMTAVVTADDVAMTKPDPASYVLAAERLGVEASECVAIEDTPTGIRSAVGAGCFTVAVCHTFEAGELGEADLVVAGTRLLTVEGLLGMSERC